MTAFALKKADREWEYYCEDCSDTGQWAVWCNRHTGSEATKKPWHVVQPCTMEKCLATVLYPHEWVKPCACFHTNPALIRKRESQAKYAEQRAVRGRG